MPLDPDIADFLDLVELGRLSGRLRPMHEMTVAEARAAFAQSSAAPGASSPPPIRVEDFSVPARDGAALSVRLYASGGDSPSGEQLPVLLFFHGGGYVVGGLDTHDGVCRDLAHHSGWAVLAVDYRLAPEHKFPTALYDALDVVAWLAAGGSGRGLDARRLAVAGDSVGGSLATVLAILAAHAPAEMPLSPLLQVLIYPVTDTVGIYRSRELFAEGYLLDAASLDWFYGHYQNTAADRSDWRFSPLHAPDLAGVAPSLLILAEYDPLRDEGVAYGERLRAAGAAVELDLRPGMTHDFLRMDSVTAEAGRTRERIAHKLHALDGGSLGKD